MIKDSSCISLSCTTQLSLEKIKKSKKHGWAKCDGEQKHQHRQNVARYYFNFLALLAQQLYTYRCDFQRFDDVVDVDVDVFALALNIDNFKKYEKSLKDLKS